MVEVHAEQVELLRKKLERWVKVAPEEVAKALRLGSEVVRREVQQKHFRLPKMARGVGDPTNAWLGTTGRWRLRNSIAIRIMANQRKGTFSAQIGTNVDYGRRHEFGLQGMPERPFLRPSLEKKRPEVFRIIEEAFMKSYGK